MGSCVRGEHVAALERGFILGAKRSDHTFLFDWVEQTATTCAYALTDEKGIHHRFGYLNGVPLNEANFDLQVNFLEYWETTPEGKVTHFAWVTDIALNESNLMQLMRGARARWKIENETFNTLKNQGYHFEHNFGHGEKNLSTVLMHLMMLAFLIDQIQQRCCRLFQAAVAVASCLLPPGAGSWHSVAHAWRTEAQISGSVTFAVGKTRTRGPASKQRAQLQMRPRLQARRSSLRPA